jgi:hypothetical protein
LSYSLPFMATSILGTRTPTAGCGSIGLLEKPRLQTK